MQTKRGVIQIAAIVVLALLTTGVLIFYSVKQNSISINSVEKDSTITPSPISPTTTLTPTVFPTTTSMPKPTTKPTNTPTATTSTSASSSLDQYKLDGPTGAVKFVFTRKITCETTRVVVEIYSKNDAKVLENMTSAKSDSSTFTNELTFSSLRPGPYDFRIVYCNGKTKGAGADIVASKTTDIVVDLD